jgi:predicted nucleotidyltransferase
MDTARYSANEAYAQEREQLLSRISTFLEENPNVKAAWLFGSFGVGDVDVLSDLDLWVVIDDDHIEPIIVNSRQFTSQFDQPIFVVEAPQNAPQGGAYLMTCYDCEIAPHIVDWYWQPASLAYIPEGTRLIFDRVGYDHKDQPVQFSTGAAGRDIAEKPEHTISFFWMMLMISAKYTWRYPLAGNIDFLPFLIGPFAKVQSLLGQQTILQEHHFPINCSPAEKIHHLYHLADQMGEMMAVLASQSLETPLTIPSSAIRYLKLVESMI